MIIPSSFILSAFLLFIIIIYRVKCEKSKLSTVKPPESDLLDAANEIISSQFGRKNVGAINFIIASSDETKLSEFSALINGLIVKCNENHLVMYIENVDFIRQRRRLYNIFILDNFQSFDRVYSKISSNTFVIDGFYLMIVINNSGYLSEIELITRRLWKIFIHNIDFLIYDQHQSVVNLMTFLPFSSCENNACEEIRCGNVKPITINQYFNGSFQMKSLHFPEKISNLHQCSVKIVAFNCPPTMLIKYYDNTKNVYYDKRENFSLLGVDGEMITALSQVLNFKIDLFHISDLIRWGAISENGTSTGAMKMIINNEADFTVGMYVITKLRSTFMTSSDPYYSVPFILIVPPGSSLASFEKLFRPFQLSVWILLLVTLIVAFIVVTVIKHQGESIREFVFGKGNRSPFLNVLIGFVGGSQTIVPRRNFARTLLMMYLLFCLVKRSLYQGALFQFLQIDERHSAIESIDELVENDYKVYMLPSSLEHTQNMRFREKRRAVNSTVLLQKRMETLDPSARHTVSSSLEQVLYYNKLNYKNNTLTVCKEYLFTFQYGIYFRKNSYLTKKFNEKISLFKASGLIDFWASDYIDSKYFNMKLTNDGPKMLNIEQLMGSFEVLFAGFLIASVVFVCEVITLKFSIISLKKLFNFFV